MSTTDHLDELRRRLIVSVLALVIAFAGMWAVQDELLALLTRPLPEDTGRLLTLSPTEPFTTTLKVVFWASVIVTVPVWLYQLYAFVIPAVTEQSRRVMLAVVAGVSGLFLAGAAFGYVVVLPVALEFLSGFGDEWFQNELRASEYLAFATSLILASGLMFEVPVAMVALARMGIASAALYRRQWRVAIVVMAVIAAVLPGGDPFSMALLMAPQLVLYGIGIALAGRFGSAPLWERSAGGTA